MEEDATIELSLSEEQLQAITGGCKQCETDMAQAELHQQYATMSIQESVTAKNNGLLGEAIQHHKEAIQESRKAQTHLEAIVARGFHYTNPVANPPRSK